ncbi:hypothetical protein BDR07DRAFT_1494395 [Suillus spraguei]|nr:hypothetical protein BDR07DRAFT_1494395 [Suillus spraguei]
MEPTEQPLPLLHPGEVALHHSVGQEDPCPVCLCVRCATKKIKCVPASMGSRQMHLREVYHPPDALQDTFQSSLQCSQLPCSPKPELMSISWPLRHSGCPAVTTPKAQSRGRSKTIAAAKTPAPAPASIPSSSAAVPRPALNVPMPGLHSMQLQFGMVPLELLFLRLVWWSRMVRLIPCNASMRAFDAKSLTSTFISTSQLSCQCNLLLDHPSPCPSHPPSALAPLIDLDMAGMEPPSPKVQDASAIESLIFEPSQIQPEGPQTSSKIVDPDDLGNLVPEYNSDDMDVEVKVEPSGDEVEMAT